MKYMSRMMEETIRYRKHATMVDALKHEHWQMFIDTLIDRIMENEGRQMIAGLSLRTFNFDVKISIKGAAKS